MSKPAPNQPPSDLSLTVSIVVYRSELVVLERTLTSLKSAVDFAQAAGCLGIASIDIVNNGEADPALSALLTRFRDVNQEMPVRLDEGHGNIGFGRGHNLSIRSSASDCHLILNPDVTLNAETLAQGLQFLSQNPEVIALSPAVTDAMGQKQYVCKRYPALFDFLLRGFAPAFVRRVFAARLAHYEMQDLPEQQPSTDIPIIGGCFMLFRTEALQAVGGFDERYFLYFEDFDLSLRAHNKGSLAYLPSMQIVHLGGHSARKGARHIGMFARSALRFYNAHGWRLS